MGWIGPRKMERMRPKLLFLLVLLVLAITALPAMADDIPYSPVGTPAPTDIFTAISTGSVTGYFYGFSAADTDKIQMCDVTQSYCSPLVFDNQTAAVGSSVNFGSVNAGDVLVFDLDNLTTGKILSSDPADSSDGLNHAYATTYSGGYMGIPAGLFLGMEDLSVPGSDLDYNDDQFVVTDVKATAAPEPSSLLLMGIGVLGLFGLRRRQLC